jgi:hypothetical protein
MGDNFVAEVKAWAAERSQQVTAEDDREDTTAAPSSQHADHGTTDGELTVNEDFIPSVYDQMVEEVRAEVVTWTSSLAREDCDDSVPDWTGAGTSAPHTAPSELVDAPPPAYALVDSIAHHEDRQATLKCLIEISDRWEARGDTRLVEHAYHLFETLEGERNALLMFEDEELPPYSPTDPFASEEAFYPFGYVSPAIDWMGHASSGPVEPHMAHLFELCAAEAYEVYGRIDGTFEPDCAWADWMYRFGKLACYPRSQTAEELRELGRQEYIWHRSDMINLWRCVAEDGLLVQEGGDR